MTTLPGGETIAPAPDVVLARAGSSPQELVRTLAIGRGPSPVIVVCGGADSLGGTELETARALVGPAIAEAAGRAGAIVVDGATDAGVMRLVGAARAAAPTAIPVLLGVAPRKLVERSGAERPAGAPERVPIEPHHTHVVLVEGDSWGDETPPLFALAGALAGDAPVAVVLAGGGDVAVAEAAEATGRGWPLFCLADSGGTAARIAAGAERPRSVRDPALQPIVASGRVRAVRGRDFHELARRLVWELHGDTVLQDAWRLFATFDAAAARLRHTFERFQAASLSASISATLLALLHLELGTQGLRWSVIVAPLVAGALIAVAIPRSSGKRWVALRSAAESVKSEIYRYRTRTSIYAAHRASGAQPGRAAERLAEQLNRIQERLMEGEASGSAIQRYDGPLPPPMYGAGRYDDGLHALDADEYLALRVDGELRYYNGRVRKLGRRRAALHLLAAFGTAAGVIVAAAGAETWVALTAAIAAAPLAYLAHLQVDSSIVAYNQSASRLEGLARRWRARPQRSRTPQAVSRLVTAVEAVLTAELEMWVEEMNEALRQPEERTEPTSDAERDRAVDPLPPRHETLV